MLTTSTNPRQDPMNSGPADTSTPVPVPIPAPPPHSAADPDSYLTDKTQPEDLDAIWQRTKCLACGHLYEGPKLLEKCPKCGNIEKDKLIEVE